MRIRSICLIFSLFWASVDGLANVSGEENISVSAESFMLKTILVSARNSMNFMRLSAETLIPLSLIQDEFGVISSSAKAEGVYYTEVDNESVPNQLIDSNGDGELDCLLLLLDYPPSSAIVVKISKLVLGEFSLETRPLTQAEMGLRVSGKQDSNGVFIGGGYLPVAKLSLPSGHKIGDKLIKYEGFGWESDKIAYRYYFDERGLVDIFGKRKPELVLARVGIDGSDYHVLNDWGMDVLKVGPSLGLAGIALWRDEKLIVPMPNPKTTVVLQNGSLKSSAAITGLTWEDKKPITLGRSFSILAGSHLTHSKIQGDLPIGKLAIGLVKHDVALFKFLKRGSEWNYLATFGRQSLANDNLGMAVFFRHKELLKTTSDSTNELVILNVGKSSDYYFGGRWEGEHSPLPDTKAFISYLEQTRLSLNNPISIELIPSGKVD